MTMSYLHLRKNLIPFGSSAHKKEMIKNIEMALYVDEIKYDFTPVSLLNKLNVVPMNIPPEFNINKRKFKLIFLFQHLKTTFRKSDQY